MSAERVQYIRDKVQEDLDSGELTTEEVGRLSGWLMMKALGDSLQKALDDFDDQSPD